MIGISPGVEALLAFVLNPNYLSDELDLACRMVKLKQRGVYSSENRALALLSVTSRH